MLGVWHSHPFWAWTLALTVPAVPALAREATPLAKPEWPKTIYTCRHSDALESFGGTLEFSTIFTEQGTVFSDIVHWSAKFRPTDPVTGKSMAANPALAAIDTMVLVQGKQAGGTIAIAWPSANSWRKPAPDVDPAVHADVTISFSGRGEKLRRKERWHQSILVRDSEVLVVPQDGDRYVILSPLDPALVTDFDARADTRLTLPAASLLAWGSGLEMLIVYDVFVTPRKYRRDRFPNGPAGRMRVIGEYRIDIASFTRAFVEMRAAHGAWRQNLGDVKSRCEIGEMTDPSTEILAN